MDGWVEVNRNFLFIEHKKAIGSPIPKGQELALRRLAQMPRMTVLIIRGCMTSGPVEHMVIGNQDTFRASTPEELRQLVKHWACASEGLKVSA